MGAVNKEDFTLMDGRETSAHLAALQSAYLILAQNLAARGQLDMRQLASDLELMIETQDGDIWREDHQTLADALRALAAFRPRGK